MNRTWLLVGALVLVAAPATAAAQREVGVVVTGEATMQAPSTAVIGGWLEEHGHHSAANSLEPEAINRLVDCFVLEDMACAQRIAAASRAEAIVYARIEAKGKDREVSIAWIPKNGTPAQQHSACQQCTTDALKITIGAMLFALAATQASAAAPAAAASAPAPVPAAEPAPAVVASAPASAAPQRHGLAVGAEVGEPTSVTAAWFFGALSIDVALGTGTYYGPGFSAHADVQYVVYRLAPSWPLRVGLGGRYYDQHYTPMSIDETPGSRWGVRASAQLAYESGPLAIYAELAPGVDLARSPTCSLVEGPNSLCPHAMATPAFMQLVVGARWFLSH